MKVKPRVPRLPPKRRVYRQVARAAASEDTERRVMEAASELFAERAYDDVRLEDVAELAGVTSKTIIRRFENKEGLARAFIAAGAKHNAELRAQVPAGQPDVAIDFIVGMYESVGDMVMRTLALDGRVDVVTEMAEAGRTLHWQWLQRVFGPNLSSNGAVRDEQLAALLVATDVFTWKLLRRDRRLSRPATRALVAKLVRAALAEPSSSGA